MASFQEKLRKVGFSSYAEYLRSPLWKGIRERAFAQHGCVCLACRRALAEVVHHTEYSLITLRGECIETLQPLCTACHDDIHGRGPDGVDKFQLAKEPKRAKQDAFATLPSVRRPAKQPRKKKNRRQKTQSKSADRVACILKNGLNPRAFKLSSNEKRRIAEIRGGGVVQQGDYGSAWCPACNSRCPKSKIRYTPSNLAICERCLCSYWARIEDEIEAAQRKSA